MQIKRGDMFYADLSPVVGSEQGGVRPVLIIQNDLGNKYKIKQIYNGNDNNSQEVLEPSNIAGVKLIKEGNNLKLENSNLNLTNILQNYEYISDNVLDLSSFIDNYKNDSNAKWEEKDDKILLKTSNRTLYINRENGLPEKMEILDNGKKTAIYILYNEVNVNS